MKRSELRPTTSVARPHRYSSASSNDGARPPVKAVLEKEIAEAKVDVAIPTYHKPFCGTAGKPVRLFANCYEILTEERTFHFYECIIFLVAQDGGRNTVKNRQTRRAIFWDFMEKNQTHFGIDSINTILYDDEDHLFAKRRLNLNDQSNEYECHYDNKITYKCHFEVPHFRSRRSGNGHDTQAMSPIVQNFLNLLVTQIVRLPCTDREAAKRWLANGSSVISVGLSGRQQYGPINLEYPYKLYQGIMAKVKPGERAKPYLNIGIIHEVMIELDMSILDLYAYKLIGRPMRPNDWENLQNSRMTREQMRVFDHCMNGIEIVTTHGRKRHYQFEALVPQSAREMTIAEKNMTVEQYFRHQYNIKLEYPNLPLIRAIMGSKKSAYIPIELCRVPIRKQKKRLRNMLSTRTLSQICQLATKTPSEYFKQKHIVAEESRIFGENPIMEEFGVVVSTEEMPVDGRVITAPRCKFSEDDLRSRVVEKPDEFYIAVCNASRRQDNGMMNEFIYSLQSELDRCELEYRTGVEDQRRGRPQIQWDEDHFDSPVAVENYMYEKARQFCCGVEVILFVFLIGDSPSYSFIKTAGDLRCGTSTQCVNAEKFAQGLRQNRHNAYVKGIVSKIIVRLGGVTNIVLPTGSTTNEAFNKFTKRDGLTMFVGMYSAKTPHTDINNTVLSLTFSIDAEATKYATIFYYDSTTNDFCDRTEDAFYEALRRYYKIVGCLPKKLMIMRSGLTDNVIKQIAVFERTQIRTAWRRFCNGIPGIEETYHEHADIDILHIGIERKHKMRFIKAENESHRDRRPGRDVNNNIDKGTVVDSVVTGPEGKNFYLCSHKGLLGTSRPAHYRIFKDEWNIYPDDLQALLYCLCHLVGRSRPSVGVPAPLYYAQLVCDRARQYVFRDQQDFWDIIHRNVMNFPFFT